MEVCSKITEDSDILILEQLGSFSATICFRLSRESFLCCLNPHLPSDVSSSSSSSRLSAREHSVRAFFHPFERTFELCYRYLLGSGGTLMFDVTIVVQSFLYRPKRHLGRRASRTLNEEEQALLRADATGAEDAGSPSRRRTGSLVSRE